MADLPGVVPLNEPGGPWTFIGVEPEGDGEN